MTGEPERSRVIRTVGEFTSGLTRWFAAHRQLANVAISGEVSDLHDGRSGHLSFKLKEEQAVLECVAWADKRRSIPEFKNGTAVIACGNVRIRPDRSGYQLHVESIELTGLGDLFLLYERLKERFRSEGLFEESRKRPVPELPRRVALISARGKAVGDFMETLERSAPFVEVVFVETRVQGVGAEIEIAGALDDASRLGVDAIVLTRGGGTYEDLFPFNREAVVRAIVRAKAPVLTAIGHEDDHHLADEAADRVFGTPSKAAEAIARGWLLATRRLQVAARDLQRAVRDVVVRASQRFETACSEMERAELRILAAKRAALAERSVRLERHNPQRMLADVRARLAAGNGRLDTAAARLVSRKAHAAGDTRATLERCIATLQTTMLRRLERGENALDRCDPLAPLARGYAIVSKGGRALRDAAEVRAGDAIEARLERGMLAARVESVLEVNPHV